jgi:hypothetical protein
MTENLVNGKIYVGVHSQKGLGFDGYLGTNYHLKQSVKKYGKKNFQRNILSVCLNKKEAFQLENFIVNEDFVGRKDTYNIRTGGLGGTGGLPPHNKGKSFEESYGIEKASILKKQMGERVKDIVGFCGAKVFTPEYREKMRNAKLGKKREAFTKEHKMKMSESAKNHPIMFCPNCGISGNNMGSLKRWHFNNCKERAEL